MNRAYSILETKALDDDKRTFSSVATTPRVDRMGDSVDPMGAKFKNPLVLLHQHDSRSPIGTVRFSKPTPEGIEFEATIPKVDEPGLLKDRVDLAWAEIKAGLVRAVSIGFRVLDDGVELLKTGGLLFSKIEILELSAVSVPANADCTIQTVKSFDIGCPTDDDIKSIDTAARKAAGVDEAAEPADKAVTGKIVHVAKLKKAPVGAPFVINRINRLP
jgi:HK97 family phage prohead protease